MDNWFNSKWFVRAVSFAFAILIYVFVNIEVTTTQSDSRIPTILDEVRTLNDVPLDIRIDSDRYVVSGVPEFVTVTLEGPTSTLTPLILQRNFDLYVDLQGLGEGTHTVEIEYARVPDNVNVYIDPKTIEVRIEERASEEFEVSVDFINQDQLPDGYELGKTEVNPEKVTITSSRSVIDQIAMVKVYIDVAGLTEPIRSREVPVNVYDSQGNGLNVRIEPASVIVSVDVLNPSKQVPIDIKTTGELREGLKLVSMEPVEEKIEIFAKTSILDQVDKIATEEIDLSRITSSDIIEVKLDLPEGVVVEDDTIMIRVELEQTRVIEDVPITIHAADDQNVTIVEPEERTVSVTVTGPDAIVNELTKEQIKLSIDTRNLNDGEHRVTIDAEGPENVTMKIDPNQVVVNITS